MSALPPVSVVVPIRDPHPEHFAQALQSLQEQTHPDFEVVVVETPGGREAAPFVEALDDARFCLVRRDGAPSIAAARNQGIAAAQHALVAMLDGDDVAMPERLERQAARFAAAPGLSVLGAAIELIDAEGDILGWRPYPCTHAEIYAAFRNYNAIAQPAVMFRKEAVTKAGAYRESTCEDYELWSRMARAGHAFENLPDRLVRYRLHTGTMKQRQLRASLRDTLRIKQIYWRDTLDGSARRRMWLERLLLLLPAPLVLALFRRHTIRPLPKEETPCAS